MKAPSSNRGLKSPPALQELSEAKQQVAIDFLAFSGDLKAVLHNIGGYPHLANNCEDAERFGDWCAGAIFDHLVKPFAPGLEIVRENRGFKHFYTRHYRLCTVEGAECGFIALGGERQRGTFAVQITGAGCAHVTAWDGLRSALENAAAIRLTRVDVAYDSFDGAHDLALARKLYAEGAFTTNGRPPALKEMGWNDESGWTLYVGKNAGNQQLCIYEKGKEQGDKSSPWVRWEARFGSKYRAIAMEVLTAPAAFLLGHVPAMHWIAACAQRMATHAKRAASNMVKAAYWARHAYGALLNIVRKSTDREGFLDFCESLIRPGVPRWAHHVPHAAQAVPAGVAIHMHGRTLQ